MLEDLRVELTSIELRVEEYFVEDDYTIRHYAGPKLLAVAFARNLVALSQTGRIAAVLPQATAAKLIAMAKLASSEEVEPGVDTAIGRTLTTIRIEVRDARGPSASLQFEGTVNHASPGPLPPLWSAFLRELRDAIGVLPTAHGDAFDHAMTWLAPSDLGTSWDAGDVVRLPHVVTAFEHHGPLFLRTGQLPGPSSLYRFDALMLTCVDDRRVIEPVERKGVRWVLPCGGGTLRFHHEWDHPRIVIRVDDAARGIYVQKG